MTNAFCASCGMSAISSLFILCFCFRGVSPKALALVSKSSRVALEAVCQKDLTSGILFTCHWNSNSLLAFWSCISFSTPAIPSAFSASNASCSASVLYGMLMLPLSPFAVNLLIMVAISLAF